MLIDLYAERLCGWFGPTVSDKRGGFGANHSSVMRDQAIRNQLLRCVLCCWLAQITFIYITGSDVKDKNKHAV